MSQLSVKDWITYAVFIATVAFSAFELMVAGGFIQFGQVSGFLSNLREGGGTWYLNPIPWVVFLVVIVDICGFAENYSVDPQNWDIKKFAATWFKYVPIFVIFSQIPWAYLIPNLPPDLIVQTNLGITAAITVAIDIGNRTFKAYQASQKAAATSTPTPAASPAVPV